MGTVGITMNRYGPGLWGITVSASSRVLFNQLVSKCLRKTSQFPFVVGRNTEIQTNYYSVLCDEIRNWQVETDLQEKRKDLV